MGDDVPADIQYLLKKIPDALRRFTVDAETLSAQSRIPLDLLDDLISAGLPSDYREGNRYFDEIDIANISLYQRLPTPVTLGMRCRAMALMESSSAGEFEVEIVPSCPDLGHPGPCHFDTWGAAGWTQAGTGSDARWLHSSIPPDTELPENIIRIVSGVANELTFFHLPEILRGDISFAVSSGVADCRAAAAVLVGRAQESDIPARPAFGFLLSPPFSSPHQWVEFLVDGRWIAVDPILLRALAEWNMLDGAEWPPHRSPSQILKRIGSDYAPLARHNGAVTTASLPTRWRADISGESQARESR
ncbi:transglutaminase domain-containing protein [Nocardia sp. NPDC060249]|uniref:transglutaminase domain-containing protein n=1 Tax=Nocardia sp. NPDC060249 TaxID=3347082 RepID=UPI003657872B